MRKSRYLTIDNLEIHLSEWGDPLSPAVLCWHGLTRNGRDFDLLAERLSETFYVICPDLIGRGMSEWSPDPIRDYNYDQYEKIAVALLDQLGVQTLCWIGTSMGGAIGLRLAGTQLKGRIKKLILNDIGAGPLDLDAYAAASTSDAVQRILSYTANPPEFPTLTAMMNYYRNIYKTLGLVCDEEWFSFTEHSARRKENGAFSPDYDPRIVVQFEHPEELIMWEQWDQIEADVLVIRGERSDVLPAAVANVMSARGPGCQVITLPELGHAPALNTEEQISLLADFLGSPEKPIA